MLTAGSSVAELWQNHHKSFTNIFNNCWFPTEFSGILAVFYAGKTAICSIKFFSRRWGIEVMLKWFHQFFNCTQLYSNLLQSALLYTTVAHCANYSLIAALQRGHYYCYYYYYSLCHGLLCVLVCRIRILCDRCDLYAVLRSLLA